MNGYGLIGGTVQERFLYATKLRRAGVACDYDMRDRKFDKQEAYLRRNGWPAVINITIEPCWVEDS